MGLPTLDAATADDVRRALRYNKRTGVFTWRAPASTRLKPGDEAGYLDSNGYRKIRIGYVKYCAHRLAWLYVTGAWPAALVDHINGNPSDNRWKNLREADHSTNGANQRRQRGRERPRGVYLSAAKGRFTAELKVRGEKRYLGSFATIEQAAEARLAASLEAFGEYARID
jgi:hypothetical protein